MLARALQLSLNRLFYTERVISPQSQPFTTLWRTTPQLSCTAAQFPHCGNGTHDVALLEDANMLRRFPFLPVRSVGLFHLLHQPFHLIKFLASQQQPLLGGDGSRKRVHDSQELRNVFGTNLCPVSLDAFVRKWCIDQCCHVVLPFPFTEILEWHDANWKTLFPLR